MSDKGFVKLHRQLRDHAWLNENPVQFMAWVHILMATQWETGRVDLTEVYRDLGSHFETNNAWRAFIRKLKRHEMLHGFKTENLGAEAGHKQTASVTKWFEYHPSEEKNPREKWTERGRSVDGAPQETGRSETRDTQAPPPHVDGANEPDGRAMDERWTVSKKNTSSLRSEVRTQEFTPPTPPRDSESARDGWGELQNETPLQELQRRIPEGFQSFERICRTKHVKYPVKIAQAEALNKSITEHGAEPVTRAFDEALVRIADLRNPFAWIMTRVQNGSMDSDDPLAKSRAAAKKDMEAARKRREEDDRVWAERSRAIDLAMQGDASALPN